MSIWSLAEAGAPGAVRSPRLDYQVPCGLCQHWDRVEREKGKLVRTLPDGRRAELTCPRCGGSGEETVEVWRRERFRGCVLADRERNYRDDSDFYAVVWDEERQAVRTIEWATTRFACTGCGCNIDATDEVKEKARRYMHGLAVEEYRTAAAYEAKCVQVGKLVQTVNTRKVPPGTRGQVFWVGTDRFRSTRYSVRERAGIQLEDGSRLFFAIHNLEVVAPATYLQDVEDRAESWASQVDRTWHRPFVPRGMLSA